MKRKFVKLLVFVITLLVMPGKSIYAQAWLNFIASDTLCISDSLRIVNTSPTGKNYFWNISSSPAATPQLQMPGNFGGKVNGTGGMSVASDSGNFYSFIIDYNLGNIIEVNYGSSFLNTPGSSTIIVTGLGSQLSDIQVKKEGNNWLAFTISITGISRIDFGTSLKNPTAVVTNFGNIGNLSWPHIIKIDKDGDNWYGYITNRSTSSVTRLDFGTSLYNTPAATDLALSGYLDAPSGIIIRKNDLNGHYILFVCSIFKKGTTSGSGYISRFDVGTSLGGTPVFLDSFDPYPAGTELRDVAIVPTCGGFYGVITYRTNGGNVVSFNFVNNDITGAYTNVATLSSNVVAGNLMSELTPADSIASSRVLFIVDTQNNAIDLLNFPAAAPAVSVSNKFAPPTLAFKSGANYTISLLTDIGLPTESMLCKTITVDSAAANLKISPADTSICLGSQVRLNVSGGGNYSWAPSLGLSCSACANPIASPLNTQTYTLSTNLGTSCMGQATVVVHISSAVHLTVSNDTSVCSNSPVRLIASGAVTYSWLPVNSLNCNSCANTLASPVISTTYTVNGSNGGCSVIDTVVVQVSNTSQAGTITALRDTICAGTAGSLTLSGNSSSTIQWQSSETQADFGNNGVTDTTRYHTQPLLQTTYYRVVVGSGSCADTSRVIQLFVPPTLTALFTSSLASEEQVAFSSAQSVGNITSYFWDFGDGQTSTETNPTHTFNKDTTYNVCLTIYDGSNCSYTYCRNVDIKANGLLSINGEGEWSVYPNPFTDKFYISIKGLSSHLQNVEIYDVLGRKILSESASDELNDFLKVDTGFLAKGMYLLKIKTTGAIYLQKVVKQ